MVFSADESIRRAKFIIDSGSSNKATEGRFIIDSNRILRKVREITKLCFGT